MRKLLFIVVGLLSIMAVKSYATVLAPSDIANSTTTCRILNQEINQMMFFLNQANKLIADNFTYIDKNGVTITYGPLEQYLFWQQYDQFINNFNTIIGNFPPMTVNIPPWGLGPQPQGISQAGTQ